jgi:PEP-CTERM motif
MKKSIRRTVRHVVVCALATLAMASTTAPASASPILTITPSATTVSPGERFSLDIGIDQVTDLFFFDITVTIDNLAVANFTNSDAADPASTPTVDRQLLPGSIYFDILSADGSSVESVKAIEGCCGVDVGGTLFSVFFVAGSSGVAHIDFGVVSMTGTPPDFDPDNPFNQPGDPIVPEMLVGATVTVANSTSAVPEPATLGLVGAGFAAVWRRYRPRRSNKAVEK